MTAIRRGASLVLILCASLAAAEGSLGHVPFDDPVYTLLDRAYANGWVFYLPQVRPYSQTQAIEYLAEIGEYLATHPEAGSDRVRDDVTYHLSRLTREPGHVFSMDFGENGKASFDFPVVLRADTRVNDPTDTYGSLMSGGELHGSLSDRLYMSMHAGYGVALATWATAPFTRYGFPLREDYGVYDWHLSRPDTSGFTHVDQLRVAHAPDEIDLFVQANVLSQNTVNFGLGTFSLGRGVFSWGPSSVSNLLLSSTGKPFDYLHLQIPLGRKATYSWTTAFLQDYYGATSRARTEKLANIHRLDVQLTNWFLIGISESIVYSQRFELSYLNPLQLYVISEIFGGDYDNKFWGMDFVFRVKPFKFYLSAVVDDYDFGAVFDLRYYHNEWGVIAGVQTYDLVPNLGLTLEYVQLSHWIYTHRADLETEHNFNRYTHFGSHLGHFLNPNSHMIHLDATYSVGPVFGLSTTARFIQNGGGGYDNNGTPYDRGDINNPPDWVFESTLPTWNPEHPRNVFLDGIVETVFSWKVGADYRLPDLRLKLNGSYTLEYVHNLDKAVGVNKWSHLLNLGASWLLD